MTAAMVAVTCTALGWTLAELGHELTWQRDQRRLDRAARRKTEAQEGKP